MTLPPTRCTCGKKQKPCLETEETYGGLFTDVPLESWDEIVCDRCHAVIRERRPCAPVVL
jgi:phage terminase large subunit GpA-like protein